MVKRTNLPRSGTTREVGGMISASSRKNTVRDSRMEMERLTWTQSVIVNITLTLAPAFQISVAMFSLQNDSIIKVRLEYRIE